MGEHKVRDTAKLHPKTVSNHKQHTKKKPKKPATRVLTTSVKVDPRVWKVARKVAKGDNHRIQIISSEEVIVHNKRYR
jgi:hypothetical protein